MAPAIGVPAAPNETGVELRIRVDMAAASGGKPSPTRSGAARAAGVPKPAAPSIKAPKSQPMMMTWMRRSVVTPRNPWLMVSMAPDCLRVLRMRMAPKMITSRSKALPIPKREKPSTWTTSTFQTASAMTAVRAHAIGSALLAGQLTTAMRTIVSMMGVKAMRAYMVIPVSESPWILDARRSILDPSTRPKTKYRKTSIGWVGSSSIEYRASFELPSYIACSDGKTMIRGMLTCSGCSSMKRTTRAMSSGSSGRLIPSMSRGWTSK